MKMRMKVKIAKIKLNLTYNLSIFKSFITILIYYIKRY